ncbi:MAG TPA: isoamylase early set domain-containing protein [Caldilineaceae bacterium]|nr:isoamylase early set domain-containing protein [Caldilineaceae bacterium]
MLYKTPSPKPGYVRVIFELPASLWADRVFVVGDFNDWDQTATPLRQNRHGVWQAMLDLPAGRCYEFRYLIDGRWCTDAHADKCTPPSAGLSNSVVNTTLPVQSMASKVTKSTVREACGPPVPFYVKQPSPWNRRRIAARRQTPARPSKPNRQEAARARRLHPSSAAVQRLCHIAVPV